MGETPEVARVVGGQSREEEASPFPVATGISTKDLGWPNSDLKIFVKNGQWYFKAAAVLEEFGIKRRVEHDGHKRAVDKVLTEQGFENSFILDGKTRAYILHSAAVAILFSLRPPFGEKPEFVKCLKRFLFSSVVALGINVHSNKLPEEDQHQFATPISTARQFTPESSSKTPRYLNRPSLSTVKLIESRNLRSAQKNEGQNTRTRALDTRIKQQNAAFANIAKDVHHGRKDDFISGIAESVSKGKTSCDSSNENWDGSLNVDDIIYLSKRVHDSKKKKNVYELLSTEHAAINSHMSAMDIIKMQDHCSMTQIFRDLRRKLPGYFDSERKTEKLKSKFNTEFEVVLEPTDTKTGYRINAERLFECLHFVYPWLSDVSTEWWRLYGDARTYGGKKSVLLSVSNINNETLLHGINFQSPQDCWPIHIFYGGDNRINLELNLNRSGKPGYLNDWVETVQDKGNTVYVASDSMFADAILGGKLDPKSDADFNLYNYETVKTKSAVGDVTGLRSDLGRKIEREHPESLLPAIATNQFVPCANHMFARITEHLVKRRVLACLELEQLNKSKGNGSAEKEAALKHFLANINARGVRNGNFSVAFEDNKLQPITLNVKCAELISAPPSAFSSSYSHILDNVASHNTFLTPLPPALQKALKWPTRSISEYDLEKEIWRVNREMHLLCRKDPDPRKEEGEHRFGLSEEEIQEYVRLADLFHGLLLHRYGASGLYPYVMKRVDIVPILLKELPFNSLFRCSTEGGEHAHYLHQCLFYGHSSRGGGWVKEDPILTIFKWYYRQIRQRVSETSLDNQLKFEAFIKQIFADKGLSVPPTPANGQQSVTPTPANGQQPVPPIPANGQQPVPPTPANGQQPVPPTPANGQQSVTPTPANGQQPVPPISATYPMR